MIRCHAIKDVIPVAVPLSLRVPDRVELHVVKILALA
jgi:hypothetical protein